MYYKILLKFIKKKKYIENSQFCKTIMEREFFISTHKKT